MIAPHKWRDTAMDVLERIPPFGQLQSGTRKGILAGGAIGALFLLLAGLVGGSVNRGLSGALIGGVSGAATGLLFGSMVGAALGTKLFRQGGHATLAIHLDDRNIQFAPGETVSGYVEIKVDNTLGFRGGKAYLICRGFYVYDELKDNDSQRPEFVRESHHYLVREADIMPAKVLRRGTSERYRFSFAVPQHALPTHHGHICSIIWTMHATADVPDLPMIETDREILVETTPAAPSATAEGYQSINHTRACQLALTLPRVVYAEGECIQGRILVSAQERLEIEEIRVVLLRLEHTPKGDNHFVYVLGWNPETGLFDGKRRPGGQGTTYVWLENETQLGGPLILEVPQTEVFTFEMDVPAERRPTFSTREGRVTWKVGVVVGRVAHTDIRAFHEVIVHTGAPHVAEILKPDLEELHPGLNGRRSARATNESAEGHLPDSGIGFAFDERTIPR